MNKNVKSIHNKSAPYWAVALFAFCLLGLSSTWLNLGKFWNGYAIDIFGPAWNYILFRVLFTKETDNLWRRFFTPIKTYLIFIFVAFGIETLQYFKIYDSTFDVFDLLAYISVLTLVFLIDLRQQKKSKINNK